MVKINQEVFFPGSLFGFIVQTLVGLIAGRTCEIQGERRKGRRQKRGNEGMYYIRILVLDVLVLSSRIHTYASSISAFSGSPLGI